MFLSTEVNAIHFAVRCQMQSKPFVLELEIFGKELKAKWERCPCQLKWGCRSLCCKMPDAKQAICHSIKNLWERAEGKMGGMS